MKERPDGLIIPEHNDNLAETLFVLAKDVEMLADEITKIRVALERRGINVDPSPCDHCTRWRKGTSCGFEYCDANGRRTKLRPGGKCFSIKPG